LPYDLLEIRVERQPMRFLKMINPSIGTYHIEGVPENISTVKQALRWRSGTTKLPSVIT